MSAAATQLGFPSLVISTLEKKKEVFSFAKGWGGGRQISHFSKPITSITCRYKFSKPASELQTPPATHTGKHKPLNTQSCMKLAESCVPLAQKKRMECN